VTEKRPQTIQFFLPEGEPRGIRIAEITTRIVQAVLVPRTKLIEAAKRDELNNVGVYLEWHCIKLAKQVGRFHLANGNEGSQPFVTEPMLADLMDAFDTLNVLTSALGLPLARPTAVSISPAGSNRRGRRPGRGRGCPAPVFRVGFRCVR